MTNIGPVQQEWQSKSNEIKEAKLTGNGKLIAIKTYQRNRLKTALTAEHCSNTVEPGYNPVATEEDERRATQERLRVLAFNYYCIPGSENTRMLMDQVYAEWRSHKKFQRVPSSLRLQEFKTIIEGIVSNVLYADMTGHNGVHVSRETGFLSIESRYRPTTFNRRMLTVIDELHARGFITQVVGQQWNRGLVAAKQGGCTIRGRQTELHSTTTLRQLAASCAVVSPEDFTFNTERQEIVILKRDKSSALVEYEDTPETEKLRNQVKIINKSLEGAGCLLNENIPTHYDQRRRFLVRKFTYGSFESGGRLSGGFWMNMKRVERPVLLRINGQKTVEVDYTCVMTHIAYAVVNAPLPHNGDLYSIPGLSEVSRPGIKKFISALYFKESLPDRLPQGVAELLAPEDRSRGCAYVLKQILVAHAGIAHLFGSGQGHRLQNLESRIMVNVMVYCAQKGITVLPIHDCCISEESKESWVRFIMGKVSRMVIGREIPCEVKTGGKEEMIERDDDEETV